ncbi:early nodulin-like protein 8 [Cornus florida]|uniref:early nodulin-like protein 8 n=1 Tax=Cornus florida TaxID=4283 RepID=UPI00289BD2FF|nr:early nodulin-like protein 8 [Cornus florida]
MGSLRSPKQTVLYVLLHLIFLLIQTKAFGYQYKVGDLDAWGVPTPGNSLVYTKWSKNQHFKIGDSLLFLYPPSQDSVIQVTEQSHSNCNLTDPILYINNGNSLFNITSPGQFYFTSAVPGHCKKSQKLHISVLSGNGTSAFSPSYGPTALPATSPSYPTVFGSIPAPPSSSPSQNIPVLVSVSIGFLVHLLVSGSI